MELGEGEAQICRLCGQCESIYIDVFGEEGTKRFLGLKIHAKINILIDERDPLPKAICVQCLGKLEFVCDFQEECLRTQQVLRDRYNLPPLTEIAEVKTEDTAPSTSTNNNNNDTNKNLNSPSDGGVKQVEQRVSRTTPKPQRNLRSQQQVKSNEESTNNQNNQNNPESLSEDDTEIINAVQSTETSPPRWLRSRQNTETSANETASDTPIANRLRSHDNTATEININSPCNNSSENVEKPQDPRTIQIPTSALNKLLSIVSNSPNIEVSVKESRNQTNDSEDISFIVELCKKESEDVATVRARVFPDKGSCLVDKDIIALLQNQNCVEINSIINTIINSSVKNGNSPKAKDSTEFEQKWQASQNPEELFKIDGEEIRVDDNVEHVVTDSQNGYACKLCCKFYERKDKCMVHVKTHLGIKQYTCILCNAKFVCKSDVMKHIRCSHTNPRPIQCPKCPKRFKSKFYLMEHDNVHKGVRPYSCSDCGQSYHHKVSLQIHMKSHLPPQNLACEYCGKIFPYRTRLLSHVASVHLKNRRNFRCRFCYNLYSSLAVLNEHIKTRHTTTYTCDVCNKTFKVASKFKAHVLQHSNPKPFACSICNNRYASKAFLNEHLLKHEGLRKHICQNCGARFAQASHLAAHRHVHGEKTHACSECGRKFNRRDNMKIEENDGLPQNVCLRCLGTLEFLCDFYERCHLTQKEFMQASKNESEQFQRDSDAESDKENTFPTANDVKRKAKPLSPIHSKSTKNGLTLNNASYYRTESKDEISSPRRLDNSDCNNEVQSAADRAVQVNSNLVPKKQSTLDHIIVHGKNSKDEERSSSSLKCRRSLIPEEIDVPKATVIRTAKSESMSNSINSIFKSINDGDMKSELPVRRKRGRKSKLEKMKEADLSLGIKRKMRSNLDDNKTNDNQYKRHCLRAIFTNNKSKTPNSAVISSKAEVEQVVLDTMLSDSHGKSNKDKKNNIVCNNGPIFDKSVEAKTKEAFLKTKEDNSVTCKAISVIVKQEKVETEDAPLQRTGKSNQLVWIPNEMLMQEPERRSRKVQQHTESSPVVPSLRNETKRTESNESNTIVQSEVSEDSDVSTSTDCEDLEPKMFAKQNRVTVIKSSQTKEISIEEKIGEDSEKLNVRVDEMDDSAQDELKDDVAELPSSRRRRQNSSFVESKSRDRSFGKVSELISDEQKQVIETYYTVDMSIVNSKEVQENLTIIDKKNIRCNICGTLYLRLDKCQVHIWGHLKMKPYQCKACDFATVTVSNVRCHIRKSHLKIKPFACHLCEKRYVTSALLDEHINTHTGERPFKCKLCEFASASRQMLSYHTSTHKPIKDISCQICGKKFYSRGRLRAHMIIHNKDKVVICKLCSAYLSNAESLETHHRNFHMQDYVCNVCGKHVKSRKALHNHQNVHAAAKYKCSLCPNVYKSSQILKEHLLKHKGIRKYKCNVCEKSFGQQSHLAAHMAVHSEIRFHCPACNKAFNRHDNMKIHTKRCKPFLANPDLKDLWNKKMKSASFNKAAELTEDFKNGDSSNSASHIDDPDEESSMNNIDDKEKTGMNLCKLGLNISCIKSTDQAWSRDDVYADADGITRSAEISVIQIHPENESVTVLENVLGPESF